MAHTNNFDTRARSSSLLQLAQGAAEKMLMSDEGGIQVYTCPFSCMKVGAPRNSASFILATSHMSKGTLLNRNHWNVQKNAYRHFDNTSSTLRTSEFMERREKHKIVAQLEPSTSTSCKMQWQRCARWRTVHASTRNTTGRWCTGSLQHFLDAIDAPLACHVQSSVEEVSVCLSHPYADTIYRDKSCVEYGQVARGAIVPLERERLW